MDPIKVLLANIDKPNSTSIDVYLNAGGYKAAEKALITATLQAVSGSKAKAAQVLGISLKTLYNRLHAYDDAAAAVQSASLAACTALAA